MEKFFGTLRRTLNDVGSVFREAAHDAVYDLRDNALRGFGLPGLVTTAASFSVAGLAAVGTFAITSELVSKVHSSSDCKSCCGWGSLRCKMCSGIGEVQYSTSALFTATPNMVGSLVTDLLEGNEEIIHHPAGYNAGYPLPYKKCPECSGKGELACHDCNGFPSVPAISFENLMDVPWKTWDVRRKITPPPEKDIICETVHDPALAAYLLYERDEIESGIKYDDDAKARLMSKYYRYRDYDVIREEVSMRKPGWEKLQQALYFIDAERAKRDQIIIQDVPYYKAYKAIEAEVEALKVPPRPVEWTETNKYVLQKFYGGDIEHAKDPEEAKALVQMRDDLIEQVLTAAWTKEWRKKSVEAMVQEKIKPYIAAQEIENRKSNVKKPSATVDKTSPTVEKPDVKANAKKEAKAQKADKKKERQERLAKQAAEREAALSRAKKA